MNPETPLRSPIPIARDHETAAFSIAARLPSIDICRSTHTKTTKTGRLEATSRFGLSASSVTIRSLPAP
jgi:hypothetical protein